MVIINPASKYFNIVIVRSKRLLAKIRIGLDRTIQNILKRMDSPIKSGNDKHGKFKYLIAGLIVKLLTSGGS
jgi:hypothetical protein